MSCGASASAPPGTLWERAGAEARSASRAAPGLRQPSRNEELLTVKGK